MKPSLKSLKKKAWKLKSEWVRKRDNGVCFTCGDKRNWKEQHAGHFVHKDSMDFEPMNIHCQCVACNKFKHGNLGIYAVKLDNRYGSGTAQHLIDQGHLIKKFTRGELEAIIEDIKILIANPIHYEDKSR